MNIFMFFRFLWQQQYQSFKCLYAPKYGFKCKKYLSNESIMQECSMDEHEFVLEQSMKEIRILKKLL